MTPPHETSGVIIDKLNPVKIMAMRKSLILLSLFVVATSIGSWSLSGKTILGIDPVYQQTPVWCWAAVGEMVFTYYGVANINPYGNFQCGIISLLHPACAQNCLNCIVPAGSLETMDNMLTQYPTVASQVSNTSTRISTRVRRRALSLEDVKSEIDAGRPIVAGISPTGYQISNVSQHVALIVGYDGDYLIVNDPFPYQRGIFAGNPYLAFDGTEIMSGQYEIPYNEFQQGLRWREPIYNFKCQGRDCFDAGEFDGNRDEEPEIEYGRSCRTPYGTCGPFYNQPALPVGSPCYCQTPAGPVMGTVVR